MRLLEPKRIVDGTAPEDTAGDPHRRIIGRSREGRPLAGYRFGRGDIRVSLIAGCHADEPVGPRMLRRLAAFFAGLTAETPILTDYRWSIVPHMNPDGEAANNAWSGDAAETFDPEQYVDHVVREPPGLDVEFGFPRDSGDTGARPENRAAAAFLAEDGPYRLHISFHGLAVGFGPWFLIEAAWRQRSAPLQSALAAVVRTYGYRLHDEERTGEKGFTRIAAGFCTRPDSAAMRDYFLARGDARTADGFRPSSMEFVRSLGGDPLTLVSELPLFLWSCRDPSALEREIGLPGPVPPIGRAFLQAVRTDADLRRRLHTLLTPMPVRDQMLLQLELLSAGLELVEGRLPDEP